MDGSNWLEVSLSGNFSETDLQNTYRWKLRTGKLSPDIMMLGYTQKTVIGGNATAGWTIEIWAKPALKAILNGCFSASTCPDTSGMRDEDAAKALCQKRKKIHQHPSI
jgi:hypothetical protein